MNRKKWFESSDAAKAHVAGLVKSGYTFSCGNKEPSIADGEEGYGVQWCKSSEGKIFFITFKRRVFVHWQGRDISKSDNKKNRPIF